MHITDYPLTQTLTEENVFLVDGPTGTKTILAPDALKAQQSLLSTPERLAGLDLSELPSMGGYAKEDVVPIWSKKENTMKGYAYTNQSVFTLSNTCANRQAFKNCLVRGQSLGSVVTDDQWARIKAGSFEDMFLGDIWTIGGYDWQIVGFDYWLYGVKNGKINHHHLVIMPVKSLYQSKWNENVTNNNTGYVGSYIRTTGLNQARTIINAAFGANHILKKSELLSNNVDTSGNITGNIVVSNSDIELPNEAMIFGHFSYNTKDGSNKDTYEMYGLPGYMTSGSIRHGGGSNNAFWLRDYASASNITIASGTGDSCGIASTQSTGVKPVFAIYAP